MSDSRDDRFSKRIFNNKEDDLKRNMLNTENNKISPEQKSPDVNFHDFYKSIVFGLILTIFGSLIVSFGIFFIFLKRTDLVAVPNLSGLFLEDAIVELQEKELIAYVELKFSSSSLDKGKVIEQAPRPGTMLRLDNTVTIFVSKGAIINKVDNFLGKNIDDVLINLKAGQAGDNRLLYHVLEPLEIESELLKGTIIRQEPPPGTEISRLIDLQFLVSKGQLINNDKYIKNYVGLYYKDAVVSLLNDGISFDIKLLDDNNFGIVKEQSLTSGTKLTESDRIIISIARLKPDKGTSFGILSYRLNEYPSKVDIIVRVKNANGENSLLYSFSSQGGIVKLPYDVPKGSVIELYIYDKMVSQTVIN